MKIFITGATGLVGSHMLAHCVMNGIDAAALKRKSSREDVTEYAFGFYGLNYVEERDKSFEWKVSDLDDAAAVSECMRGCDVVIHCAADVGLGGVDEQNMFAVNVRCTETIVAAAKNAGIKRFCYLSSIAALGNGEIGEVIDESTAWREDDVHSVYGRTKRAAMETVLSEDGGGMRCVAVCPGPILGVNCRNSGSAQIIHLAKKGVPFATNGGSGYVDVRDVCRVLLKLSAEDFKEDKYVLVSENVSNKELLGMLNKGFGKVRPAALPKWLIYAAAYCCEGVYAIFGKKPQLDRNMARTITNRSYYSSKRVIEEFDHSFIPLEKTASDICNYVMRKDSEKSCK